MMDNIKDKLSKNVEDMIKERFSALINATKLAKLREDKDLEQKRNSKNSSPVTNLDKSESTIGVSLL